MFDHWQILNSYFRKKSINFAIGRSCNRDQHVTGVRREICVTALENKTTCMLKC